MNEALTAATELARSLQMARRNLSYFTPFGVKNGIDATLARYVCRYCDGVCAKERCIADGMAKGVLPPCAVGERK